MLVSRLSAAPRNAIYVAILFAACSAIPAAEAASPYGDQWTAVAGAPSNASAAVMTAPANRHWAQPNQQSSPGLKPAPYVANPLRPGQQPQVSATPREPQTFYAPANAAHLSAAPNTTAPITTIPQPQRSTSAAIAPASAAMYSMPQPRGAIQPASAVRPAPSYRLPYQPAPQYRQASRQQGNAPTSRALRSIKVAFKGDTVLNAEAEDLPSPGASSHEMQPMMQSKDEVGQYDNPFNEGPFQPYGESCDCGPQCECGGQCNCGDGCSCGDGVCEPGCGCGCGDACGEPSCACGKPGCGDCNEDLFCIGPGDDESCHTVRVRTPKWQEVMAFGGVQGFKGPYDQDRDAGNFGFHEGFNIGAKLPYAEMGYQFGYRSTQSQLNGDENENINHEHFQSFATAGIFRRTRDGIQGGVVWDLLEDERFTSLGYHQLRSEISLISGGCHEFGFTASASLNDRLIEDGANDIFFEATDQYLLFYRFHGPRGGEGRFYAGGTEDAEGIVGSDMLLPLSNRFSVQAGFTYLIPDEPDGRLGASQEAWNIGLALVWHWHGQARKCHENCYRPLFNVADNGYLIVDQRENN